MHVIYGGLDRLSFLPRPKAIAIGNFDGIHIGHQKILKFLVQEAQRLGLLSAVLTFSPHPEKILGQIPVHMIQTLDQRIEQIKKSGVELVLVLPFDQAISSMKSRDFIRNVIRESLCAQVVVVGRNFRFGSNRRGNVDLLERLASQHKYKVHSIPDVSIGGKIVSSSLIRHFLRKGKIEEANKLLGRHYEIKGTVIKGQSRGKIIGFPTANIHTWNEIIPQGVFLTKSQIGENSYFSLTNAGSRPTFEQNAINIESYLLNFDEDIYGKSMEISFLKKVRGETKFSSPEALASQIKKDIKTAQRYFGL